MPGGPRAGLIARVLRWLLAALLLVLTVRLMARDPEPIRQVLHIQPRVLVAMVLLMVLNQWLMSLRFKLVMKQCVGAELSHWRWFQLTSVGQFLNIFVPQLGHVYRAVVVERELGLPYTAYATGLFVFLWFELVVGTVLAVVVVAAHDASFGIGGVPILPLLLAGLALLVLLPGVVGVLVSRAAFQRVVALERVRDSFALARTGLRERSFVGTFVLLNLVVALGHIAVLALAFDAVGGSIGVGKLMLFQVLLKLSSQIMITPGNLGLTELTYAALADAASTGMQHGIAAALVIRTLGTVVMVALGAALGGASALRNHRGRTSASDDAK